MAVRHLPLPVQASIHSPAFTVTNRLQFECNPLSSPICATFGITEYCVNIRTKVIIIVLLRRDSGSDFYVRSSNSQSWRCVMGRHPKYQSIRRKLTQ